MTLLVLAVYQAGLFLPAPGINALALLGDAAGGAPYGELFKQSIARLSLFALGTTPLLSAFMLGEVIKLAFAGMNDWINTSADNRSAFNRRLTIAALLIAALQAYGVAVALEAMSDAGPTPLLIAHGAAFKIPFIVSLVAATALCLWLADIISHHGIGSGLWVVLLWPGVAGLTAFPVQVAELARSGQIAPPMIVLVILLLIGTALLTAAVVRRWTADIAISDSAGDTRARLNLESDAAGVVVWPIYLGSVLAGWTYIAVTALPAWLSGQGYDVLQSQMLIGQLMNLLLLTCVLTPLMTVLMARAFAGAHPKLTRPGRPLIAATIGLQIAAVAAFEAVILYAGVPLPVDAAGWLALIAVLTLALPRALPALFDSSEPVEVISDDDFAAR